MQAQRRDYDPAGTARRPVPDWGRGGLGLDVNRFLVVARRVGANNVGREGFVHRTGMVTEVVVPDRRRVCQSVENQQQDQMPERAHPFHDDLSPAEG